MKKFKIIILLIVGFTITVNSFANTFFDINSLKAIVTEKRYMNKKTKIKKYKLKIKMPDKVLEIMEYPKINMGELYLYNKNEKRVYYPMLEQTVNEKIKDEENYVLNIFKAFNKISKEKELKEEFFIGKTKFILNKLKNKVLKIKYETGVSIVFYNYEKVGGKTFPKNIKIFDGNSLISEIYFKNTIINSKISDLEFDMNEIIKK
ncbi:hypothetical protein [Haliovirga abyssi]|uniref:Outer membrane lipoprotein carrier protein LolA n=1 Tax=Haliovirga abyssi TaxID=2996794 RepID=A0AAU9DA75_9FUSO|nr:hypothetical protein [Haliovirga abyssi]BDU50496.1 hypothetical protein HLVA_10650 [Haliovirga abyssi]